MSQTTILDAKGRVSIGRYTTGKAGQVFRITRGENGSVTLEPVLILQEDEQ